MALVSCNYSPPYRASEVFRRSTECASVPREGSTPQCDARTGRGEGPWVGPFFKKTLHPSLHGAGRGNPRIVKARSSHGISREHEWPGA